MFTTLLDIKDITYISRDDVVDNGKTPKAGDLLIGADMYLGQMTGVTDLTVAFTVIGQTFDTDTIEDYIDNEITIRLDADGVLIDATYQASTGIITFERHDGSTFNIDLPLELIVTSGYYDEDNNNLVLVLANGDEIDIPVGDLLSDLDAINIRYDDSDSTLTANNVKTAIDELDIKVETNKSDIETNAFDIESLNTNKVNLFLNQPLEDLNGLSLREVFEDNVVIVDNLVNDTPLIQTLERNSVSNYSITLFGNYTTRAVSYKTAQYDINKNYYVLFEIDNINTDVEIDLLHYYNGIYRLDYIIKSSDDNLIVSYIYNDTSYQLFTIGLIPKSSTINNKTLNVKNILKIPIEDSGITADKETLDKWYNVYRLLKDYNELSYVDTKANKEQENWIEPTLTNATSTYLKYRKDNFSTVIIEGNLNVSTAGTNFTLPTGYRPLFTYIQGDLTFNTDGTVVSSSTGLKYLSVRFTGGS